MWLCVNNKHEKIQDGLSQLSISKAHALSAKIIYSNHAFGQNNHTWSKQ